MCNKLLTAIWQAFFSCRNAALFLAASDAQMSMLMEEQQETVYMATSDPVECMALMTAKIERLQAAYESVINPPRDLTVSEQIAARRLQTQIKTLDDAVQKIADSLASLEVTKYLTTTGHLAANLLNRHNLYMKTMNMSPQQIHHINAQTKELAKHKDNEERLVHTLNEIQDERLIELDPETLDERRDNLVISCDLVATNDSSPNLPNAHQGPLSFDFKNELRL
ncbi:protein ORF54 [Lake sturgeon herpesvirus]|nr:protein ORF54 [Lake sturgeon herpesvirus]